ncbi:helix-turn-helix transcriptional regulator [Escherichia coli]
MTDKQITEVISLPPGTVVFDRLVYERECKALTGLCRMSRWRMEQAGAFPVPRQPDGTRNAWLLSELVEWARSRPRADHGPDTGDDEDSEPATFIKLPEDTEALLRRAKQMLDNF